MAFPTTTPAACISNSSRSRTVPAQTERPVHADADDGVRCQRVSVTPLWRRQVPADFPSVLFQHRISRCPAMRVLTTALRDDGKYARGSAPWGGSANRVAPGSWPRWEQIAAGCLSDDGGGAPLQDDCGGRTRRAFSRNSPRRFPVRAEGSASRPSSWPA